MLSGKRQHWVGLSKKSRKALERFPLKDFVALILITIIVIVAMAWQGKRMPIDPAQVEHKKQLQQLEEMRADVTSNPSMIELSHDASIQRLEEMRDDTTQKTPPNFQSQPYQSYDTHLKELEAMRRRH